MTTESALKQVGALMEALDDHQVIRRGERLLLEGYLIDPDSDIPWRVGEYQRLFEKIKRFRPGKILPYRRLLDHLFLRSQEKLAHLQIVIADMPETRQKILFFIALEIHCRQHLYARGIPS
ncbi:MAG: hypothetical protein WAV46_00445 [Candidatus Moraniibacteriota bacterium]